MPKLRRSKQQRRRRMRSSKRSDAGENFGARHAGDRDEFEMGFTIETGYIWVFIMIYQLSIGLPGVTIIFN
jgi:hypothetical protein